MAAGPAPTTRRTAFRLALPVLGVVLLGSVVYLLVLALGGASLVKLQLPPVGSSIAIHDARPWLIAATAAGALTLIGWGLAEARISALAGEREEARRAAEEARGAAEEAQARQARAQEQAHEFSDEAESAFEQLDRDRDQHEQALAALARERDEQRTGRDDVVSAWHRERDWNRRLREQIAQFQRAQGTLGSHDDVRQMVLQLTLNLVEAEKGLLLSGHESDEGRLDVVCHLGFEHDPRDSALAQRFAGEVIQRDATIREDDQGRVDPERRAPADAEVRNLLAIPIYMADDFAGVIVCVNRDGGFASLDSDVLLAVGDHAGAVLQNTRLHGDLRSAYLATIRVLANAIELKDPALRHHSDAVSGYVMAVADRLEFAPERREALIFASLLHDIGKLGISERILLKPGALTDEERSVIQLHPRIGYQLVSQIPALHEIAPAVLRHHERYDGDGYPGRLRGQAIPLEARIITVADAFSAMTSGRPYSAARSVTEACAELERCAGEQFDPEVVTLFVEEVRRRPPVQPSGTTPPPDPELRRGEGEFVLGAGSFGITDSLTLLYSHRHFHETARAQSQRAALQGRPFAIVAARLVDLPAINAGRGYVAGDRALQALAATVRRTAARWQGLAFRISGDTVALLAEGADRQTAGEIAVSLGSELGADPRVSIAPVAWQPGEDGERMIARALAPLRAGSAKPPTAAT